MLTRKTFLRRKRRKKEAKVLALRNRRRKSGRRACKSARFKNAKEAKVLALRNRLRRNRGEGLAKSAQHSGHGHTGNIATQSLWYLVPQAHQNTLKSHWVILLIFGKRFRGGMICAHSPGPLRLSSRIHHGRCVCAVWHHQHITP